MAAEQPHEEQDDRGYQEDMHEGADRIRPGEPQQPQNH